MPIDDSIFKHKSSYVILEVQLWAILQWQDDHILNADRAFPKVCFRLFVESMSQTVVRSGIEDTDIMEMDDKIREEKNAYLFFFLFHKKIMPNKFRVTVKNWISKKFNVLRYIEVKWHVYFA